MAMPPNDKEVLVVMNVDVGDGRSGRIDIRWGDDPEDLARAFCKQHALPEQAVPVLTQSVTASMQEAKAKARPPPPETTVTPPKAPSLHVETGKAAGGGSAGRLAREERDGRLRREHYSEAEQRKSGVDSVAERGKGARGAEAKGRLSGGAVGAERVPGDAMQASRTRGQLAARSPRRSPRGATARIQALPAQPPRESIPSPEPSSRLLQHTKSSMQRVTSPSSPSSLPRSLSDSDLAANNSTPASRRCFEDGDGSKVWERLYQNAEDRIRSKREIENEQMSPSRPFSARSSRSRGVLDYEHLQDGGGGSQDSAFQRLYEDSVSRREHLQKVRDAEEAARMKELQEHDLHTHSPVLAESRKMLESKGRTEQSPNQVFAHLHELAQRQQESRLTRIKQAAQEQLVESTKARPSSFQNGAMVPAFTPDLWTGRAESGYDVKPSMDRLDPLGERRAIDRETYELDKEQRLLEECCFRPQILPVSDRFKDVYRSPSESVFDTLYKDSMDRKERRKARCSVQPPDHERPTLSPSKSQALVQRLYGDAKSPEDPPHVQKPTSPHKTPPVQGTQETSPATALSEIRQEQGSPGGVAGGSCASGPSSSWLRTRDLIERGEALQHEFEAQREMGQIEAGVRANTSHVSPASSKILERKEHSLIALWWDVVRRRRGRQSRECDFSDELGGEPAWLLVQSVVAEMDRNFQQEAGGMDSFVESCKRKLHVPGSSGRPPWEAIVKARRAGLGIKHEVSLVGDQDSRDGGGGGGWRGLEEESSLASVRGASQRQVEDRGIAAGQRLHREGAMRDRQREAWLRAQKARRVAAELQLCTFNPRILRDSVPYLND